MLRLGELLTVLAQSEAEQEAYYPELTEPLFASDGVFQVSTPFARMIALCALAREAKSAEIEGLYGNLCSEIAALATLLIEVTHPYEFLVWHPREVEANDSKVLRVDFDIYNVWAVMRRLCKEALQQRPYPDSPRPFFEAFAPVISP